MKIAPDFAKEHYTHCYLEIVNTLHATNHLYIKLGFQQLERALDDSKHKAVVWPPNRAPIVMGVLSSRDTKNAIHDNTLIAETWQSRT